MYFSRLLVSSAVIFNLGFGVAFAQQKKLMKISATEWAPYTMANKDGKNMGIGFADEMVQAVAKTMDLEVTESFLPWKRAIEMAKEGEIDAVLGISYNEERAAFLKYPKVPYAKSIYSFFTKKDSNITINKMEDVLKHSMTITDGYAYGGGLLELLEANKNTYKVNKLTADLQSLKMVESGQKDLFPCEKANCLMLAKNEKLKVSVLPFEIVAKDYFLAFSQKSEFSKPEFMAKWDEAMKKYQDGPEFKKLHAKFFGE